MDSEGRLGAGILPASAAGGVSRALLVGEAAWLDELASGFDDLDAVVESDAATARERLADERFDCVLAAEDVPHAEALALLGSARETDPDCATVLVAAGENVATETAIDAAGVTEVLPAGDGEAWRLAVASLVREAIRRVRADRQVTFHEGIAEGIDEFLLVVGADGDVQYVSPSIERVTGVEPAAVIEADPFGLVHPDDVAGLTAAFTELLAAPEGTAQKVVTKARHADGTWRVHEVVATNRLADPRVEGVVVAVRDVTDPPRLDAHGEALERLTDGFFVLDPDWRFTYVNEPAIDMLGHPEADLLGESIWDVFPGAKDRTFYEEYCHALESGEPVAFEERYDSGEWFEVRAYPSESGISVYFRDVSGQRTSEQQFQAVFERAIDAIVIADDDGRYVDANPAACDLFGLPREELLGRSIAEFAPDEFDFETVWRAFTEGTHERGTFDLVRADGTERVVEFSASADVLPDWHLSVMRDATERERYEATLRALHDSTRELLGAETDQAIADHLSETASEVLDFPVVVVYYFDDRANVLRPIAASVEQGQFGTPPVFGGDVESITWTAFVDGETAVYDDVRTAEHVYDPETAFRSGLYVPLGAHGMLVVGSTEVGAFDERTRDLAALLAATGEAAFDRVERESALRERDRTLQEQNSQLRRLNRVNEIIREIDTALVQAESRAEIERAVTERLTKADRFALAWIGDADEHERLQPSTWAGTERGYLDAVEFSIVNDSEPATRAVRDREVVVVENVAAELRSEPWRKEALARNYQSALAVPLVHDGFAYGVLAVYATRPRAFDETTRAAIDQLGRTIAYAIDAVERKRALLSDDVTELEFSITDDNCPFFRLARRADCRLHLEGFHAGGDGVVVLVTVADVSPEQFVAAAVESTLVDDASVIRATNDGSLVELRYTGPLLTTGLADRGVVLADLESGPSGTRVILEVPGTVDVRSVVETVGTALPDSEFLARRECSRPLGGEHETVQRLLDRLTDRQREVLQVAYHGGYFESPRTATGEELATALGVSPPAFHGHLRALQRKLFAALLDSDAAGLSR